MDIPESIQFLRDVEIRRHRRIWKPFMEKYDCQKVAEVGVFQGQNFGRMMEHGPELIVGVDHWKDTGLTAQNDSGFSQEKLDWMYDFVMKKCGIKKNVLVYREDTVKVASFFEDNYFDLVYIDADHSYEGCARDLEAWYPKVKSGKFFTGDDYVNKRAPNTGIPFGVKRAVNEFAKKNNLDVYELSKHGWAIIKP